jgi:hypothetical protein
MLSIPHCLENWLTDGDKDVSLTHRQRFTLQKHYFLLLVASVVRVQAEDRSCGIYGGQSDIGAGFLQVLQVPLSIVPPTAEHSSSCGAGTVGQTVAGVPSGLSHTPPQEH